MAKARKAPRRGASRQQPAPRRPVPGWLWLVSGLAIGLFVAFLLQLEPGRETVKRDKTPPTPPPSQSSKASEEPRYDFYTLLPESEVIVPQGGVTPEPPATEDTTQSKSETAVDTGTRFFLQAGSFRKQAEADRVRAQILLLGLDVRLEDARLDSGDVWYRVQVGPYTDRTKLSQAQQVLTGNGFDNLLLQQRDAKP
ncbi:SPOR domain-containing protein [uncultured Halopseudomonas sp.]|uniref:SPOR domain-containing protein n=1 Tax=uncultured Halopseudomonas sp. TaxID=2901193 RepID=UPI0030EBE733|tara:strand:- start:2215 stop:2805 length:591 start_codon:yes stop_codon:yes gene_type:complete